MEQYGILIFRPVSGLATRFEDQQQRHLAEGVGHLIFYLLREDDLDPGDAPLAEELAGSTAGSWEQIGSWLRECEMQHKRCYMRRHRDDEKRVIPTRLLDLRLNQGRLRVVATETLSDEEKKECRYATLSHCWGSGPDLNDIKLLVGNKADYTSIGIEEQAITNFETGNRNFAHAIEVARHLGLDYIWIDSLCIIQNSEDKTDWLRESLKMHEVYQAAYCNIGAAHSVGRHGGLFRERSEAYHGQQDAQVSWRGAEWRVVPANLWESDLMGEVLYSRGWVFQGKSYSCKARRVSISSKMLPA